jgi:hypothetical protein
MLNGMLKNCGVVPLHMANLHAMLENYDSPKDKISYMEKKDLIATPEKALCDLPQRSLCSVFWRMI